MRFYYTMYYESQQIKFLFPDVQKYKGWQPLDSCYVKLQNNENPYNEADRERAMVEENRKY